MNEADHNQYLANLAKCLELNPDENAKTSLRWLIDQARLAAEPGK